MKILLDECVDRHLAKSIPEHTVSTVPKEGWAGLENGDLFRAAQEHFDVFLTTDQSLRHQQNLSQYDMYFDLDGTVEFPSGPITPR